MIHKIVNAYQPDSHENSGYSIFEYNRGLSDYSFISLHGVHGKYK